MLELEKTSARARPGLKPVPELGQECAGAKIKKNNAMEYLSGLSPHSVLPL